MRQVSRRKILGSSLVVAGALLALAGIGASFGFQAHETAAPAAGTATDSVQPGGVVADLGLDVRVLDLHASPAYHLDPAQAQALPVPGLDVERDVSLPLDAAPVGVGAHLALQTGAKTVRTTGAAASAQSASVAEVPVLAPALPVTLAVAAFAGAGLLAYFWAGVKKLVALPFVALYAKITRAEVFDNDVRERIFAAIKASPGLSASELSRLAGVAWGTTIYHLDVLEQTRMATSIRQGRHRRYFENGAVLTTSKETLAILRNPVTLQVADRVRETPGLTQKDLASATGLTPQALHWHLTRLVGAGVVRKQREGRVVRHFVA